MGEMSGLLCVDVDTYKNPELLDWVKEQSWLHGTLVHKTRSGGLHFIFKHPGNGYRFPATLRDGVDIKANGSGYICFPPTKGYEVHKDNKVLEFPISVLQERHLSAMVFCLHRHLTRLQTMTLSVA